MLNRGGLLLRAAPYAARQSIASFPTVVGSGGLVGNVWTAPVVRTSAMRAAGARALHSSRSVRSRLTPEDEAKMKGFLRTLKGPERQELRDLLRSDRLEWREKEKAIKKRLREFEVLEAKAKQDELERKAEEAQARTDQGEAEKPEGKHRLTPEEKETAERARQMEKGSPYGGPAEPPPLGWQQYTMMVFAILLFFLAPSEGSQRRQLNWDEIRTMLEEGKVGSVTVYGDAMVRVTEKLVQQGSRPVPSPVHWYEIQSAQAFQSDLEKAYNELDLPWDQRPSIELVDDDVDLTTPQTASPLFYLLPLVVMLPIWLM